MIRNHQESPGTMVCTITPFFYIVLETLQCMSNSIMFPWDSVHTLRHPCTSWNKKTIDRHTCDEKNASFGTVPTGHSRKQKRTGKRRKCSCNVLPSEAEQMMQPFSQLTLMDIHCSWHEEMTIPLPAYAMAALNKPRLPVK